MELTTVEQIVKDAQRDMDNAKDAATIKEILMRASEKLMELARDKAD